MRPNALGWGSLAAVLAIPMFLFYRWKLGMHNAQTVAISEIAHARFSSTDPFGKSPAQDQFQNPLNSTAKTAPLPVAGTNGGSAIKSAVAAAQPAPAQAQNASQKTPAVSVISQTAAPLAPSTRRVALPAPASQYSPLVRSSTSTFQQSQPTPASYKIDVARDPTLSPEDYAALKQAEFDEQRREWLLHHPKQKRKEKMEKKKIYKPPVESTVQLMGIIYAVGNSKAIVDDETVGVGSLVRGIRVIEIGPNYVVFQYGHKTFKKTISR